MINNRHSLCICVHLRSFLILCSCAPMSGIRQIKTVWENKIFSSLFNTRVWTLPGSLNGCVQQHTCWLTREGWKWSKSPLENLILPRENDQLSAYFPKEELLSFEHVASESFFTRVSSSESFQKTEQRHDYKFPS